CQSGDTRAPFFTRRSPEGVAPPSPRSPRKAEGYSSYAEATESACSSAADRDLAQLDQHAELITHHPFLRDPAVVQPELNDRCPGKLPFGGDTHFARPAAKRMRPYPRSVQHARRHQVTFRDQA